MAENSFPGWFSLRSNQPQLSATYVEGFDTDSTHRAFSRSPVKVLE